MRIEAILGVAKPDDRFGGQPEPLRGLQHGAAEAAGDGVIFNRDDRRAARQRGRDHVVVDRLGKTGVDDRDKNILFRQQELPLLSRLQAHTQSNPVLITMTGFILFSHPKHG